MRGYRASLPPQAQAMLAHIGQASATGTPQQAADHLAVIAANPSYGWSRMGLLLKPNGRA